MGKEKRTFPVHLGPFCPDPKETRIYDKNQNTLLLRTEGPLSSCKKSEKSTENVLKKRPLDPFSPLSSFKGTNICQSFLFIPALKHFPKFKKNKTKRKIKKINGSWEKARKELSSFNLITKSYSIVIAIAACWRYFYSTST